MHRKQRNVSDISKSKTYLIHSIDYSESDKSRGYLSATSSYLACTSKTGNWAPSSFAFVQYDGKYFLYDVANKKFARTENYSSNSAEVKGIETNTSILPVTFDKISDGVFKIKMGVNYMNFSSNYTYGLTINYYSTNDAGNNLELIENGSFDDTEAIATLESYLANPTIVNGGKYKIKLNGTSFYVSKDASGNAKTEETASELIISENGTNAAGKKAYSIKDADTNKYLSYTNITYSGGSNSRLSWADTDTNSKFVFTQGSGTYSSNVLFRPADACDDNYVTSWNQNYSDQIFVFWTISNTMSYWTLEKVTKTVTYNLKWNGSTLKTNSSVSAHIGGAAADDVPWDVPAYSNFTYDVETIGESTTEVEVTLTWNGPFDFSTVNDLLNPTDSEIENANWYYMTVENRWIYSNESDDQISFSTNIQDALDANTNALWAFVGNPIDGVRIINKAKNGSVMVLWTPCRIDATTGYTHANIVNNNGDLKLIDDENYYLHYDSGNDKIWTSQNLLNNSSSTITVISYYCGQALKNWANFVGTTTGSNYFDVTSQSATNIENMILSLPKMTESQYNDNFATIPNANISSYINYNLPSNGYYRIKNISTNRYIAYGQPAATGHSYNPGLIAVSDANDASTVIKLTSKVVNDNVIPYTYALTTQGLNVQIMRTGSTPFPATTEDMKYFVFNIVTSGVVSIQNTASSFDSEHTGCLHDPSWDVTPGIVNWNAGSDASKWVLEEATSLSISLNNGGDGNYYATLCLPFDVTLSGASAYTLTLDGNELTPSEAIASVPAGTPVLLVGSTNSATATIGSNYSTSISTGTALTGSYTAISSFDGATNYVLGTDDTKVGFFHWQGTELAANRAYLAGSNGNVKGFYLNWDEADGIRLIDNGQLTMDSEKVIYNLAGQRVQKTTKGLYIVNGKKVVIK